MDQGDDLDEDDGGLLPEEDDESFNGGEDDDDDWDFSGDGAPPVPSLTICWSV
jgi:hypothetical protein